MTVNLASTIDADGNTIYVGDIVTNISWPEHEGTEILGIQRHSRKRAEWEVIKIMGDRGSPVWVSPQIYRLKESMR